MNKTLSRAGRRNWCWRFCFCSLSALFSVVLAVSSWAQEPEPPGDPMIGREVAKRLRLLLADARDFREQENWERYCQAFAMIGSDVNLNRSHLVAAEPEMNWEGLQEKAQRMFAFCFLQ